MSIITEEDVRKILSSTSHNNEIYLDEGQLVTPSARSYLNEHNIAIKSKAELKYHSIKERNENNKSGEFETLFGARLNNKPEHMTHLRGNVLVFK